MKKIQTLIIFIHIYAIEITYAKAVRRKQISLQLHIGINIKLLK